MLKGEIYLAAFPFGDVAASKLRPVLLLTGAVGMGMEVVAAYITSVVLPALLTSDLLLDPALPQFRTARLKVASVLRLHKIATIHQNVLQRRLGNLSVPVMQDVETRLRAVLTL